MKLQDVLPTPSSFTDSKYADSEFPWKFIEDYGVLDGGLLTRVIQHKETGAYWQCQIYFGGSWDQAGEWREGNVSRCEPRQVLVTQYFNTEPDEKTYEFYELLPERDFDEEEYPDGW